MPDKLPDTLFNHIHRKLCTVEFKVKGDETGPGSFSGYGSTFGNYDRSGEAVAPDAFKNLDQFIKDGFGAVGHNWSGLPIATIESAKMDDRGLHVDAEFHSHQAAQDARTVAKERLGRGKSAGLSIGYSVLDAEPTDMGVLLKAIHLYEVSMVTVPCNPLAGMSGSKSLTDPFSFDPFSDMPHAGMSMEEHSAKMLAVCEEWIAYLARLKGVTALRQKSGRVLSAATRTRLSGMGDNLGNCREAMKAIHEDLNTLLDTAEDNSTDNGGDDDGDKSAAPPAVKFADPDVARAAYSRFLAFGAMLNGVDL